MVSVQSLICNEMFSRQALALRLYVMPLKACVALGHVYEVI
jgi:hypothetical protein